MKTDDDRPQSRAVPGEREQGEQEEVLLEIADIRDTQGGPLGQRFDGGLGFKTG